MNIYIIFLKCQFHFESHITERLISLLLKGPSLLAFNTRWWEHTHTYVRAHTHMVSKKLFQFAELKTH